MSIRSLGSSLRSALVVGLAATIAAPLAATVAHATVSPVERRCAAKLARRAVKLATTYVNATGTCREREIAGTGAGACPDATALAQVDAVAVKLESAAARLCKSTCSLSPQIECIAGALCPPAPNAQNPGASEGCTAGARGRPFEMGEIGFPGPVCDAFNGGPLRVPADIGRCVASAAGQAAADLVAAVYGGLTSVSGVSAGGLACLRVAGNLTRRLARTIAKGVAGCRDAINKGRVAFQPDACRAEDDKLAARIARVEARLAARLDASCTDAEVSELDLCGTGQGGTASVADAAVCLIDAARQAADGEPEPNRDLAELSIVEAAYPARPRCGDGVVNQLPDRLLRFGEECDGADDDACPGLCIPPGDVFECTCGDVARMRVFFDAAITDSDGGWSGTSHNQGISDRGGFMLTLSGCDCDELTGAACTGASADSVCDVYGLGLPRCSADPFTGPACDAFGNGNGLHTDSDCFACDEFSANTGAFCRTSQNDCQSQCYPLDDPDGAALGVCDRQSDCAAGEICRGQCDRSRFCNQQFDGGPLPVGAANAAVCQTTRFSTDITGTHDLVTGAFEYFFDQRSQTFLPDGGLTRPCPVCGGFCDGGDRDHLVCAGRCDDGTTACRTDADCAGAETCSVLTPDCPGGACVLADVCGADPTVGALAGELCTVDWEHELYGTLSADCPPPGAPINGQGFRVPALPLGSAAAVLPSSIPCTATGLELFDCPCPDDGGAPTKPNGCAPACNVAPNLGVGCATGNNNPGDGTRCDAGANVGRLCDADDDCPGGACADNPTHCSGDPAFEQLACADNADCGLGACVDACPGGRCVPLCLPIPADANHSGQCAAGPPIAHCSGLFLGRGCDLQDGGAACDAACSVSGTPCTTQSECPQGEVCQGECPAARNCEAGTGDTTIGDGDDLVGAGLCVVAERECFLDPITGTGVADPAIFEAVNMWCFSATSNIAINTVAGFGGPGRSFQRGSRVVNVGSIP